MAKSKKKKALPSQDEEQRKELYNHILELRAYIQYGEELVIYFKQTNQHFDHPQNRVKGTDLIDWELNGSATKAKLKALEKMYKKNYE